MKADLLSLQDHDVYDKREQIRNLSLTGDTMNLYQEAARLSDQNRRFAWTAIVSSKGSTPRNKAHMIVLEDGSIIGTIGGGLAEKTVIDEAVEAIREGCSRSVNLTLNSDAKGGLPMHCGGDMTVFIDVNGISPKLLLIGGGHVNQAVYRLGRFLGYECLVVDERPEFASRERFPEAAGLFTAPSLAEAIEGAPIDENTAVVIATKDADEVALRAVFHREAGYVGVIGSRRKVTIIRGHLLEDGYSKESIDRVYAPIGLDLGSETPEEIAVSILAEVLKARTGKTGISLSESLRNKQDLVIVRGAGDVATGTIVRLHRCGWRVLALEADKPTVVRRTVALAEAVTSGTAVVEGVQGTLCKTLADMESAWAKGMVPVAVDPSGEWVDLLKPKAVVDAILAKRNVGTEKSMAPVVIGLGPGFIAGEDVHAVIETNRGHALGRAIYAGAAEPDTGMPGNIAGYASERVLRSPTEGVVKNLKAIGDWVEAGETVMNVSGEPVKSEIAGILRGLIADGMEVEPGFKIGDVDPRGSREACFEISDKALAVAGGVLEAILHLGGRS